MVGCFDTKVRSKLRIDVLQASWEWPYVRCDGKGQADCMPGRGVGILTHDEYPDVWEG
jgi:hypothetical protein